MARQLQLRRGTTAESTSFIGALGEVTVDTSNYQLRVHDGTTPGGHIVGGHTIVVSIVNLFDWKWTDHLLPTDQDQWVLADANEWIYATDYPDAYQHLVNDFESTSTWESDTIAGYTIGFKRSADGHKITDTANDNETVIQNIFTASGYAWYYLLDTENQRFKLPRTKYGVTGLHDNVGNYVEPGLPNVTGGFGSSIYCSAYNTNNPSMYADGPFTLVNRYSLYNEYGHIRKAEGENKPAYGYSFDASRSSPIYGASTTVQPPATQMYLYFCLNPAAEEVDPGQLPEASEALKNQNDEVGATNLLYNWEGTLEEYLNQDIEHTHPEWICFITDDVLDTAPNPAYYVHRVGNEVINGYKTFINTIYAEGGVEGTASSAKWADLAERYQTDAQYPVGTLVKFGGTADITIADSECHAVISEKPGYLLDSGLDNSLPIALSGKTPVRVIGKVKKFDKLILSDIPGVATAQSATKTGKVIGIALENSDIDEEKLVLSVVKLTF